MTDLLLANMRPTTLAEMYNDLTAEWPERTEQIDTLAWKVWRQLTALVGEDEAKQLMQKVTP